MDAVGGGRRQIEDRHADVAAHCDVPPRLAEDVGNQRRRRRLSVRSGDGDEWRVRRARRALSGEEFDVADDLEPRLFRALDGPMGLGMRQRHARRQHERSKAAPVGGVEIEKRETGGGRTRASLLVVVPGGDVSAARDERAQGRKARAAEPEQRDAPTAEGLDRRHAHLNFNVERPTIASTKATIQNRMTICGSDQPSCSKW